MAKANSSERLMAEIHLAKAYYLPDEKGKLRSVQSTFKVVESKCPEAPSSATLKNWLCNDTDKTGIVHAWFAGKEPGEVKSADVVKTLIARIQTLVQNLQSTIQDLNGIATDLAELRDKELKASIASLEQELDAEELERRRQKLARLKEELASPKEAVPITPLDDEPEAA